MSIKTIRLYGDMGKRFGRVFKLDVNSPSEAIRALTTIKPGFREYLQERFDQPFRVLRGEEALDEKGLSAPVGRTEVIKIVPMVAGAKDGFGQILMGAVLLAAAYWTGGASVSYMSAVWGAGTASVVGAMGMAMVLGGVASLLAPVPQNGFGAGGNTQDAQTWAFGSPTLTTGQGGAVPVLLGEMRIGGHVVSAGIDAHTWQVGGFDKAVCLTDDGAQYGNGDSIPWMWAKAEA